MRFYSCDNNAIARLIKFRARSRSDCIFSANLFRFPQTRFLEAQNRKLAKELKDLQDRWGIETKRIKQMYETEMAQLRKLLDESERAKGELQVQVSSLEDREVELEAT